MMGLNAAGAPGDYDKALALVAAFAKPEAVTAHIDMVRAEEAKAQAAIKDANDRGAILDAERKQFEADKAERIKSLDAREGELNAQQNEIDRQKAQLQRDKDAWLMADAANKADRKALDAEIKAFLEREAKAEADLKARSQDCKDSMASLIARGVEMDKREAALAEKEAAYQTKLDELNNSLKKLRG